MASAPVLSSKFCRLEKGRDGSKAFAINTQEFDDRVGDN